MRIVAEWFDGSAAAGEEWTELWTDDSRDAVERAQGPPGLSEITYGATGLRPGKKHRFRVGWCREAAGTTGCGCFSAWGFLDADSDGTPDEQPQTFPTPPITSPIATTIEDRFDRPDSDPKRDRSGVVQQGDGLGPDEIWIDDPSMGNYGAEIEESGSESYGLIPSDVVVGYRPELADPDSYAELVFRPHCSSFKENPPGNSQCTGPATNYRAEVRTRSVRVNGIDYSYVAQALFEPNWSAPIPEPRVRLIRAIGNQGITDLVGEDLKGDLVVDRPPFSAGIGCTIDGQDRSPTETDIAMLKDGDAEILLRLETRDQESPTGTLVRALLAWDCTASTCAKECYWEVEDLGSAGTQLFGTKNHRTGFTAHHWDMRTLTLRAGSEP